MNAFAFAAGPAADVALVDFDRVLTTDGVTARANHARAQLVQDLEGRLVPTDSKLALELQGRHARRLGGHEVGAPEPRRQRRVGLLHHGARRERHAFLARAAAQNRRAASREAVGLLDYAALRAGESIRPAQRLKVLLASSVIRKHALEFGEAGRKVFGSMH